MVWSYGDIKINWYKPSDLQIVVNPRDFDPKHSILIDNVKKWVRQKSKIKLYESLMLDLKNMNPNPHLERERLLKQLKASHENNFKGKPQCSICGEYGGLLKCERCTHTFHDICLNPPLFLDEDQKDADGKVKHPPWQCRVCSFVNGKEEEESVVRMGLTPDWLIHEAAFNIFQLKQPTLDKPYIEGLLDPCTNNKLTPNIPAEKLYDKKDDGLDSKNSWKGYHVILNPEYSAKIQWRFANRAIDEVENDNCPAIILVCRNSTDSAYFHRLLPYPRVLLRRRSIHFKDYEGTPIGFGIVVFCIARQQIKNLYKRFYDAFSPYGECNIPIDSEMVSNPVFYSLISRLEAQARRTERDSWIQCCQCAKWRLVPFEELEKAEKDSAKGWKCTDLKDLRRRGGCECPQTPFEIRAQKWHIYSLHIASDKEKAEMLANQRKRKKTDLLLEENETENLEENDNNAAEEPKKEKGDDDVEELALKFVLPLSKMMPWTITKMDSQEGALTSLELARTSRITQNKELLTKLGLQGLYNDPKTSTEMKSSGSAALPHFMELQRAHCKLVESTQAYQAKVAELHHEKMKMWEGIKRMEWEVGSHMHAVHSWQKNISDLSHQNHFLCHNHPLEAEEEEETEEEEVSE